MRKLLVFLATGLFALGMAGAVSAAVLNWEGTLIVHPDHYPPGVLTGGGVATVNASSGGIPAHLSALRLAANRGQARGTFVRLVTDPDTIANGIAALVFKGVGGRTGTWAGISGGVALDSTGNVGQMPVGGIVKICILSTACTQYIPMVLTQPTTVNGVPGTGMKGVGVGGLITAGGYGGIRISLQAAPWTIKTATLTDENTPTAGPLRIPRNWMAKGWAHAPASTTTSTAQPSGVVQLVTPARVFTNLPFGRKRRRGWAVYVIHFIPEPGMVLLLGSGVAGLALLGRRRMRQ